MLYPKNAAYHEAGHAVMGARAGLPSMGVEIHRDGSGMTHGTDRLLVLRGQYAVWDDVVCSLGGPYAEARATKVSFAALLLRCTDDYTAAAKALTWLVANKYARNEEAAWRRAEDETKAAITKAWPTVSYLADLLRVQGHLEAQEVARIIGEVFP